MRSLMPSSCCLLYSADGLALCLSLFSFFLLTFPRFVYAAPLEPKQTEQRVEAVWHICSLTDRLPYEIQSVKFLRVKRFANRP